jgi:hypothetical protein
VSIGGLTVENGADRVTIYGSLDLTRDKQGLAHVQALKGMIDQVVLLAQHLKTCAASNRLFLRPVSLMTDSYPNREIMKGARSQTGTHSQPTFWRG